MARAIKSKIYENFSDTNGIMPINPQIIKSTKSIKKLDINKLELFTKCDAKIIHQDCAKILKNTKVLLLVKSTFMLGKGGTKITNKPTKNNFICQKTKDNNVCVYINCKKTVHINYSINYANINNIKYAYMSMFQIVLLCDVLTYQKVMKDCFYIMQHLS